MSRIEEIERSPEYRTVMRLRKLGVFEDKWPITRLFFVNEPAAVLFSIGVADRIGILVVFASFALDNIDMDQLRSAL